MPDDAVLGVLVAAVPVLLHHLVDVDAEFFDRVRMAWMCGR